MHGRFSLLLCGLILFVSCGCAVHQSQQDAPLQTAEVNGVQLGYRILGNGPPLLLIMGYAGTMDVWDPAMVSELSRQRTVILFDNRGMGYSSIDEEPVTMELMASDGAGLLKAIGIERADVMGWSMGSIIAQEMALAYPDRVGKMILYGTAVDSAPVKAALDGMGALSHKEFVARLFPDAWKELHPDIYSRLPSSSIAPSAEVIGRQYQALVNWPGTKERLAKLNKETLVIVGQADRITPPEQAMATVSLIDGAWLARFIGADHWLMYQAGKDMASVVEGFLRVQGDLLISSED